MSHIPAKPVDFQRSKSMFFILSTGRSGIQFMAKTLSKVDGCICLHEPSPALIIESSNYRYGLLDAKKLADILLKSRRPVLEGCIYGESNQTLSLMVPVLSKAFPASRFVWLVRNGFEVVASTYSRQWYTGHSANHKNYENCPQLEKDWIDGRIRGDLCGDVPEERWRRMSPFAKCCWYWGYANRIIEQDLKSHCSEANFRMVRLEELDTELEELVAWLGFQPPSSIRSVRHSKPHEEIHKNQCWTDAEVDTFTYWCGPMMDRLYPSWRSSFRRDKKFWCFEGKTFPAEKRGDSRVSYEIEVDATVGHTENKQNLIYFTPQKPVSPQISIYITSYNQKKYLAEAIESVLAQTLKPSQIIVVDDGSTDGSQDLIRSYARKHPYRFDLIFHDENCGVATARMHALQRVTGDYVSYLDGDDRYIPTKLEKEFSALIEQKHAYIAYSNNYYINASGDRCGLWIEDESPPQGWIFPQTFSRLFPKRSLFRMELVHYQAWKAVGFHDPNLSMHQDFDMRIRLTKHFQAVFLDEPLSEYRLHGAGLSNSKSSRHLASLEYLYRKNMPLLMDLSKEQRESVKTNFENWTAERARKPEKNLKNKNTKFSLQENSKSKRKKNKKLGREGEGLIFLISQPRSGSTLLQRILNAHPEIHSTAEPWLMLHPLFGLKSKGITADYDATLYKSAVSEFLNNAPEGEELYYRGVREMALCIYNRMLALSGKSYFLDKTPRYYQIIPELYRVFPRAHFIVLLRNPLGVLSSILQTWFMNDAERLSAPILKDLLSGPKLLLRGIRSLKENAIVLDYESMVKTPERTIRNLCCRIGLPYQPPMLEYGQSSLQGGRFGDPKNIHRHSRPVEDYIEKWVDNLHKNGLCEFSTRYLSFLTKEVLDGLGYSSQEMRNKLNSYLVSKPSTEPKAVCCPAPNASKSNEFLISAVVSAYNSEKFIRGCLEDLENQTIAHKVEIIVVNSGSAQNEEAIVRDYQNRFGNIKYIQTKTRETVYAAWNRAIKLATGKYITNANTDDRHRRDAFEIMAQILEDHPDIALVYADVLITKNENETFENCTPMGIYRWLDWDRNKLLFKGCFMGPQPMWRRDVHEEYGYFDENLTTSGDYEFWLRISQTRKFFHLPIVLGLYLKSPSSIEHRNRQRQCMENQKILEMYRRAHRQNRIINRITMPKSTALDFAPTIHQGSKTIDCVIGDYLQTAETLFQKELIDEGIEMLLKAIGADAQDGRTYIALAEHLINHGRHQQALEALAEMPVGLPEEILAEKALLEAYAQAGLGRIEEAGKTADEIGDTNQNNGRLLNLQGMLAYYRGDKAGAEVLFRRAIEAGADYGEPHTNLGSLFLEKGKPEEAMECFLKGFSLSPTDVDVANLYHESVTAAGDFAGAEKLVVKLLKKFPDNRKLRYLLIDVLIQQDKMESALEQMQQAVAVLGTGQSLLDTALALRGKVDWSKQADSKGKNGGEVSLCMIVKDEEEHLARCLASVEPIVDEMIVVDTGSQDRTKDVASLFGAKIYDFEWSGDFAAARNFSISKATCGWILVMDADEVISKRDYGKFRRLVRKRPKEPVAYAVTTRNYCNLANTIGWEANRGEYPDEEAGWGWLPSTKVRLFVRDKRIRFEGAVHEMVDFVLKRAGITFKDCNIPVHHYGRLDAERLDRKGEIYYEIGRRKLEDTGNDIAAIRELAVQATILGRNEEALDLWSRFLAMEPPPKAAAEANVNLATLHLRRKSYQEAETASETALALAPDMKEALYNVALSRIHLGRAPSAIEILEQLVEAHEDYAPAQFMLTAACFISGNKVRGQSLLRDLRQGPLGRLLAQSFGELVRDLEAAGQTDYARNVLGAALENDAIDPRMASVLGGHAAAEAPAVASNG